MPGSLPVARKTSPAHRASVFVNRQEPLQKAYMKHWILRRFSPLGRICNSPSRSKHEKICFLSSKTHVRFIESNLYKTNTICIKRTNNYWTSLYLHVTYRNRYAKLITPCMKPARTHSFKNNTHVFNTCLNSCIRLWWYKTDIKQKHRKATC